MAAPEGNQNAVGNRGGKSLQDRQLAAEVRRLTLERIKQILEMPRVDMNDRDRDLYEGVLLKLAGTVLPRLNEHSGPDGEPLILPSEVITKNALDTPPGAKPDSQG